MEDRERACWVAFNRAPGVGVVRFRRLLEHFGSLEAAWTAPRAALAQAGLDKRALDGVEALRRRLDPAAELSRARELRIQVLTWEDEAYPALLRQIGDPPPVLYVKGEIAAGDETAVAMVGTRRATVYGRDVAERLAQDLAAEGITVVSGLAKGIDTHAHRGALAGGGRTLAVLGHGLDTLYPPENRRLAEQIVERGALVSDYAVGVGPMAENFPPRNRIISGLAAGVIVVEADEGSGALITSKFAEEQDRDVFAVPGPITSPASRGCHRLIQDGAKLVTSAADVLQELNPHLGPARATQLALELRPETAPRGAGQPAAEDPLIAALRAHGQPMHVDLLSRTLGLPVQAVTGSLTLLELQGKVRHAGGMRYQLAL